MSKTLYFQNKELANIANTLSNFDLKRKASLGRSRLIHQLLDKIKQLDEDKKEIQKKYFEVDEDGNLKTKKDGKTLILKEGVAEKNATDEINDLYDEKVGVSYTEFSERYEALYNALVDYDEPLSGMQADVYARLIDEFETNKEKEND